MTDFSLKTFAIYFTHSVEVFFNFEFQGTVACHGGGRVRHENNHYNFKKKNLESWRCEDDIWVRVVRASVWRGSAQPWNSLTYRIWAYTQCSSFNLSIGRENSPHLLPNQSDAKQKSSPTWYPSFSRALGCSPDLICCCDNLGFNTFLFKYFAPLTD